MLKPRMGFTMRHNAFTALDEPQAAQKLADSFPHLNWPQLSFAHSASVLRAAQPYFPTGRSVLMQRLYHEPLTGAKIIPLG